MKTFYHEMPLNSSPCPVFSDTILVMNIYVDFDDCLCETARYFSGLVKEMFNLNIPYEQIHYFNLQKSFDLTDQ